MAFRGVPARDPTRPHTVTTRVRYSQDTGTKLRSFGTPVVLPPPDAEGQWRIGDLDTRILDKEAPAQIMQYLADLAPEFSAALWHFARFSNPGWELVALQPGTGGDPDSAEADPRGQAWLDEFVGVLTGYYQSLDVIWARLHIGAFMRGAYAAELVLNDSGREALDFATPDPSSFRFQKREDPDRGEVWQLGQLQGWQFVPITVETVAYLPIDPFPASPYGRPPASAALFTSLFLIAILHDLRRVVQQQGWPRYDLAVQLEKLRASMPEDVLADPEAYASWINHTLDEIAEAFTTLPPDAAFAHTDDVTVGRPTGAVDSSALSQTDLLINALERMLARGLKTMPVMLGLTEGMSEANANRQYEAYIATIQAFQHHCENLVSHLFTLGAQAAGIQTNIVLRFAVNRAAEAQRDAVTESLQIANAAAKRDEGWNDQDTASREVTGHDAVAESPAPAPDEAPAAPEEPATPADSEPPTEPPATPTLPLGAGRREVRALPPVPDRSPYLPADRARLRRKWDAALPEYAGLLAAAVVGADDDEDRTAPPLLDLAPLVAQQQNLGDALLFLTREVERQGGETTAVRDSLLAQDDVLTRLMTDLEHIRAALVAPRTVPPPQTINIEVPPANGHARRVRKTVERDASGQITGVVEEALADERDDAPTPD